MRARPRPGAARMRGLSLIEILATMGVTAVALLGALGLQMRALAYQQDSFNRKAAASLVTEFAERVRANHLAFAALAFNRSLGVADEASATPAGCANASACTSAEVAARDVDQWFGEIRRRWPATTGAAFVEQADARFFSVTLAWKEPLNTLEGVPIDTTCARVGVTDPGFRCFRASVFP